MPAKDLGTKHNCYKCGVRFYDLKKPTPICPKCGADQRESPALKPPTASERRAKAAAAKAEEAAEKVKDKEHEKEKDGEEGDDADEADEPDDVEDEL